MASYAEVLSGLRKAFSSGKTKSIEWRKQQLKGLMRMYEENEGLFTDALHKDLRKPKWEASMAEVEMNKNDIRGNKLNSQSLKIIKIVSIYEQFFFKSRF